MPFLPTLICLKSIGLPSKTNIEKAVIKKTGAKIITIKRLAKKSKNFFICRYIFDIKEFEYDKSLSIILNSKS